MTRFPLFAALAAMSLLFSCNKSTEDENPKANKPLILIQTRTVSVEAQGGACEILYTVENAVSGVSMEASCDADWISNIDCSVENKVTFTVAPNDQAEERTAPVILRLWYGDGHGSGRAAYRWLVGVRCGARNAQILRNLLR